MFHRVTVRFLAVAVCGWLLATEAGALSLGRARGATLIGRALDVAVPVTLEGNDADNPCASAEVFYGDTRVQRPTVRWEPTGPGQGVIRVLADAAVDEPTVTVYLRVGCAQANTRKYVLLSEPAPADEPAARTQAARPLAIQPPVVASQRQAAALAPAAPGTRSPRRRDAAPAPTAAAAPVATPPATARRQPAPAATLAATAPLPRARRQPASGKQARLHLEPLDLSVDRDPMLRLTSVLGVPAAMDPQQRAGLSAFWQALQKDPTEFVQDALRMQGLERELISVRDTTRQNAVALNQMRGQVQQAQGDRKLASFLVAALGAVLVLLLAWMAWRWHRVRQLERVGRWFDAHGDSVEAHLPTTPETGPTGGHVGAPAVAAGAVIAAAAAKARSPVAAPAAARASTWGAGDEFQASRGGTLRMVGVQELIDVHDKADFFLSIGETGQAVAVLDAHVHDQVETGALAWLDLMELYHSLGKRVEFERLRGEFRQRFTAQVPDFEHFDQPTASLENYSRALSRIVALWPSQRVLDVIEESIFRKPGLAGAEPFSLEAYRELVLLFHIARDMAPEEQPRKDAGTPTNFAQTSLQPLNMIDRPDEAPLSEQEKLMIPPPSARLGVDIDLDGDADAEPEADSELKPLDFDISTFDSAHAPDESKGG